MLLRTIRQITRTAVIIVASLTLATWTAQPALVLALEPAELPPAEETTKSETEEQPTTTDDKDVVVLPLSQITTPETITQETDTSSAESEKKVTASSTLSDPLSQSTDGDSTMVKTDASLHNTVNSDATTGNALGEQNTTVGDISTGDAVAMATLINMLLSSVQLENGEDPLVFIYDVLGDVAGNLLIDPNALATNSATSKSPLSPQPEELQSELTASINNNLNLNAISGDATAQQNTTAGDVSTGDAAAIANVINLINSAISANQSFIGVINIFGSLNGDILVPYSFVEQLLASHHQDANPMNNETDITSDLNATVNNTVNANAQSGSATASDNSFPGDTSSGNANTNITIFNLTSQQIIGGNVLLVFVNVLGNWVGLLLDAPAGTTSAAFGDGSSSMQSHAANIDTTANLEINNNINANAQSGNATANENTSVGTVTSGEATVGVNLLNIMNSDLSLANWFGILFINVFGQWVGNFAVAPQETASSSDTPKKNTGSSKKSSPRTSSGGSGGNTTVFSFVPQVLGTSTPLGNFFEPDNHQIDQASATSQSDDEESLAGDTAETATKTTQLNVQSPDTQNQAMTWLLLVLAALGTLLTAAYAVARHRRGVNAERDLNN